MSRFTCLLCLIVAAPALAQVRGVEHVVVFGIDGLGSVGLEKGNIPNVGELIKNGAHTFKARGVMPTVSAPNWASMISGAGPEQHGVVGNDWPLPKGFLPPIFRTNGETGLFPTIFYVLHKEKPTVTQAVVHDWDGFSILFDHGDMGTVINGDKEDGTATQAIKVAKEGKPNFLFVHFDNVDHALHGEGFASDAYFAAVNKMDALVGSIIAAIKEAGYFDKTVFLLTADHGGNGKSHGQTTPDEITIPWVLCGPSVKAGFEIMDTVNTYDTAATLAHIFGAKAPQCWIGRPVLSAFK